MNTATTTELLSISSIDLDTVCGGVDWKEVGRRAVTWGGVGATGGAVTGAVVGGVGAGVATGGAGVVPGAIAGARVGSVVGRVGGAIAGAGTAIYDTWNK